MAFKRFSHLNVPEYWERYFTKYPQGMTILESLFEWVSQVDSMTDNVNDWNTYLENFVKQFDTELQGTVTTLLQEWRASGLLDLIIDEALRSEFDEFDERLSQKIASLQNQMDTVVAGVGNPDSSSAEIIQARSDLLGNTFSTVKGHTDNIENILLNDFTRLDFNDYSFGAILSNGETTTANTYIKLDTLQTIKPDESITFVPLQGYKYAISYYDAQGNFVKRGLATTESFKMYYDTPQYKVMIGLDDTTPITLSAKNNLRITKEQLSSGAKKVKELKEELTNGFLTEEQRLSFYNWESGAIGSSGIPNSNRTFIKNTLFNSVQVGKKIKLRITNGYKARIHWYSSNEVHQLATQYVTTETTFTAPYPKFKIIITYDEVKTINVDAKQFLVVTLLPSSDVYGGDNPLIGKTIYSFGTSILAGHLTGISFPNFVAERNKMNYTKYAVNGHVVVGELGTSIINQINNASSVVPDFIILDSWANNAYPEVTNDASKLGVISDGYTAALDLTTYSGALENIFKTLQTKYFQPDKTKPSTKILHIGVHKLFARDIAAQDIIAKRTKEICDKWSIDYLDLYNRSNLNMFLESYRTKYSYDTIGVDGGSGTHLNDLGNLEFYVPQVENKLKTMIVG